MTEHISPPVAERQTLTDPFARTISYLRLSLTDRCNLRCLYCVSEDERHNGRLKLPHRELLSYEELLRVVRAAAQLGITKVRLTGGEPLVRRQLLGFIARLRRIEGLRDLRMTTNGVLLEKYAPELFTAGVDTINISLDSLKPHRFAEITGVDCFARVWRGLEVAMETGFSAIKLNMVVMRGVNDDELVDFATLSLHRRLQVRFIEFMPIGAASSWRGDMYMSVDEIMARLRGLGELLPAQQDMTAGPARVYRLGADAPGSLGFISPLSHQFCERCNRLRLTSEGKLRSCLLHDAELDLRTVIRAGGSDADIRATLISAIRNKPKGHEMAARLQGRGGDCHGHMSRIGG